MHAMMYGNMNRGMGGQPQPQRQGGRNRNRNFRNSRFDQPHQQNRNVQQPNRNDNNRANLNNVEVKPNNEPPKPVQTPKPIQQNDAPTPSKPAQNQQQQNQPKPQAQPQQIQPKPPQTPQQKPPQTPHFQQQQKPQQVQQKSPAAVQQQPAQQPKPAVQQPNQAQPNVVPAQTQQQQPQQIPVQQTQQHHQQGHEQNGPDNLNTNQNPQKRMGGRNFGGQNTNFSGGHSGNFGGGGSQAQSGGFGGSQGNFGNQGGNFGGGNQGGGNFGGSQGGGNFGANKQAGPRNMRQGGRGQDGNKMGGPNAGREEHILAAKLKDLAGPLTELPPIDQSEVKFNGRSRMYIGNLSSDITEQEIQDLFTPFGETSELFVNKDKNFAFIRMDFRANAEKAKRELDGHMRRGRPLRIRFAPHNSAVKVRNLTPFVSNELLYRAFEIFGKIERAYVKVDDRGKTLGEGVVEFARKASALSAIRNCTEKCFFLTSSLRPVIVESYEEPEELDGYQEKNLPKKHPDFMRAREFGPRFSEHNSFEHEYGTRWKQLHELYRQKEETLQRERAAEEDKLEAQMEFAKYEHETEMLREQLRQREQDRERQKRSWEMAERAADERLDVDRAQVLRQEEELAARMRRQEEELRRRQQENTLFMQAQHLNSMLDQQEQGMFDSKPQMDGGYMEQYDMGRGYDDMMGPQRWDSARHPEDFPNKRRRY